MSLPSLYLLQGFWQVDAIYSACRPLRIACRPLPLLMTGLYLSYLQPCAMRRVQPVLYGCFRAPSYAYSLSVVALLLLALFLMPILGCRHLVGIAGMPGSGKSTAASHISSSINSLWTERHGPSQNCASCLPMDGEAKLPCPLTCLSENFCLFCH